MNLQGVIDSPLAGSSVYRQRVPIEGWVYLDSPGLRIARIAAHVGGIEIGSTAHLFLRADVVNAHNLPVGTRTGFKFLGCFPNPSATSMDVAVEVRAELSDGSVAPLGSVRTTVLERDFTTAAYGDLCNPDRTGLLHREHLYSTGRPAEAASVACVDLLLSYLPAGASVLDVGCGVGAYCDPLTQRGHAWIGCETNTHCLLTLQQRQRPSRPIARSRWPWSKYRLPAANGEFDAAVAVEVLEHVRDPNQFLAEMARVTRRHAFFSVPNLETLPFLSDRMVAPWHLLEGDHVNFFTRFNLGPLLRKHFRHVEIIDYGAQPLASPDGLALPYHLFAICEV
jgi:2-polyprenyl-3-methyl-5-hydroxy-6-metoxy-1,4-benzoquinol methylase